MTSKNPPIEGGRRLRVYHNKWFFILRNIAILFLLAVLLPAVGCGVDRRAEIEKISTQIRSILELPTFEHIYRDVVYLDRERTFLIFKTMDTEVLFAIDVRIQAGIDLGDGFAVQPVAKGGIRVSLPPAKILLADANEESIKQYFLKEVGGSISRLDYYDEINRKKEELIADAIERGILERAGDNARLLIRGLLENTLGEEVTFVTTGGRSQ